MTKRLPSLVIFALLASMPLVAQTAPAPPAPDCKGMMAGHSEMKMQMSEMDKKLQAMVDEMNHATGSMKVDKMAMVISELVAQRSMMQKQMMSMHDGMEHPMDHDGMMKGMDESMACCSMKGHDKAPSHD